jgi:hypothetical protein
MSHLKRGAGRWAVPAVLAAVLAAALLITPVIAGTSGVTAKKVNKTIAKKTNVTVLNIPGAPNLSTSQTALGTMSLGQGSYDVSTTFDVRQNALGANIQCVLRINGVGQDQSDTFVGSGTISDQSSVAMNVAGVAKTATTAQLLCSSTQAANINHAEITALKVPGVKVVKG